ncbi:MAG TPA: asparagine synthase-related protein [Bryobacteraceae bacterium]|nr:asparagine synthase-related protein [Bryobacteraceae bacterium]
MKLEPGVFHFNAQPRPHDAASPIFFDGRLDNRPDLLLQLRDLLRDDVRDAALAFAAFQKWGVQGLAHLIGDWSLVIWDEAEKSLLLASDFAGVRPLYYCLQRDRLLWSTRLGALVDGTQAAEIDDSFVAGFLAGRGSPNRTPYRGIFSVPPGQALRVTKDGVATEQFWKLPIGNIIRYRRELDYEEHLRSLFREAVGCRLRGAAPVLSELSGGLDSSSIVCMASHLMECGETPVPRLLTVSYEYPGSLDTRFWRTIEDHCHITGVHVPTADFPFLTENHTGGDSPAFWEQIHNCTSSIAREAGANTYLTGRMGDLTMGNWGDDSDQVAGLLRRGKIGDALRQSLAWSKLLRIPIYWVLGNAFLLNLPPAYAMRKHEKVERSAVPSSTEDSIAPEFLLRAPPSSISNDWMEAPPERRKHFRSLTETLELRKLQPPEPLQHLLYTHPYAHRPLVEFMSSIPADMVCRPGEPRRLMRRALHELWPPGLRKRRSKGSFSGVFLDSLRPLARWLLEQPCLQVVERGYVSPASLKRRLDLLTQALDCNEPQLRQIILLELWLRNRFGKPMEPAALVSAAVY